MMSRDFTDAFARKHGTAMKARFISRCHTISRCSRLYRYDRRYSMRRLFHQPLGIPWSRSVNTPTSDDASRGRNIFRNAPLEKNTPGIEWSVDALDMSIIFANTGQVADACVMLDIAHITSRSERCGADNFIISPLLGHATKARCLDYEASYE